MSEFRKELVQLIGQYGQIGITFVACIFIGLAAGIYIDQQVFDGKSAPWSTFIGLAFGIAAGFKTLFSVLSRHNKEDNQRENDKKST